MSARWLLLLALALLSSAPRVASAQAGWRELDLGGGRRATRFLPSSVRACDPLPMLLFLHGAGGTPEAYASHLEPHAEALGLVLLLPQSSGASGWGGADGAILNAALDAIALEVNVDDTRTYLGGHSAGGAFSYILAYESMGIAAVFSMSAPFYMVGSLGEPGYPAPIRMYYGDTDPNYMGGSATALAAQWDRLGVPNEADVQSGFGHSTWPASSIRAGFEFLLARRHPGASPASRCGEPDGGLTTPDAAAGPSDAGTALDALTATGDAQIPSGADAALARVDAGPRRPVASSCACRAASDRDTPARWAFVLAVGFVALRERRRRRSR